MRSIYIYIYIYDISSLRVNCDWAKSRIRNHDTLLQKTNSFCDYLIFTYLLTPHSRLLLEKLTDSQLVKIFPAFYGTRRFITAFTSTQHLSLS